MCRARPIPPSNPRARARKLAAFAEACRVAFLIHTDGLRRGLHSCAASRLMSSRLGSPGTCSDCTYSGAEKPSKKTLVSAQNLENKRPKIFPPARSMVLKVVRGKILETLELWCSPTACGPVLELRPEVLRLDFQRT